ncbi:16S rRNA (cytidine(1402)-2'-O)-methyltransferase [Anaeroselena agilis]|uniref:Ribosomal RNA small subunit methyltransferase I n=1 Tax=Anaeroselena agilis TaxID=3063788 RepID=A0ABU3P3S7_9FIRM|nr:16S rRNA (cytidine(1402)-2'-O)-methyltransferase [Selenomonadales bacterium 4137-cl]
MEKGSGTLYLCATPIGNLEDMTFRGVRVLKEAAVIAAEDTRHTRKLLSHFDIHTPLVSYHEHNKAARGPELVARLSAGEDVAVVSDAGLPGISDPGADLVRLALAAGVPVTPVPGANAALAALVASGLDTAMFLFVGFLPRAAKKRRELVASLAELPYTLIFYESPHRLADTLAELTAAFGDRPAVVGRELTKKFEEFAHGPLATLGSRFAAQAPRGEITLVVAGGTGKAAAQDEPQDEPATAVARLVDGGTPKKEAIRRVAAERGLPRREVYQAVVAAEK